MRLPGKGSGAPTDAASATADYGKTAGFLAVGVGLTGVITYVYFFIASHVLSKPDYGQITVLWSAVFITISTLYRPVEQLLSRHISEHLVKGESIGGTTKNAATIQVGLAMLFAVLALALRGPIQNNLLEGNETLYWVYFSAVLFYAASYFARGFLAGQKRFGLFTALILSESCFRTLFAVLVAVSLLEGQSAVAIGIVAAPSLSLMVVPLAFARRARTAPPPAEATEDDAAVSMAHGTGFAAAVLVIMFSEQAFLNAGPLIARGLQGAAAAGFIFNVLMLARAPLQLFQAVSTSILPHLTSLHTSHEAGSREEFHRSVRMVLLGIAAFTALMALVILAAGPELMQIAFSKKFSYDRAELLVVAAGTGLYLCSVTVNQAGVAQGQVRRAAVRWIACAGLFIAWNFVPLVENEFHRIEIGFTLTAGVLFVLLYLIYRHPHERVEDVPVPGSPGELEMRLAAVDENT
ncbi:MAG: lipopolysaccharide biosynthesis protein [Solirubrobacterales bacterium]